MGGSVAQHGFVFENVEASRCDEPARRRTINLPHGALQSRPQKVQVRVGKAGVFGQVGIYETVAAIESVRNCVLAAHGACDGAILFGLLFSVLDFGNRFACDRKLKRNDWIDGTSECELDRTADLTTIHASSHNRPECTNVVKIGTHPVVPCWYYLLSFWLPFLLI